MNHCRRSFKIGWRLRPRHSRDPRKPPNLCGVKTKRMSSKARGVEMGTENGGAADGHRTHPRRSFSCTRQARHAGCHCVASRPVRTRFARELGVHFYVHATTLFVFQHNKDYFFRTRPSSACTAKALGHSHMKLTACASLPNRRKYFPAHQLQTCALGSHIIITGSLDHTTKVWQLPDSTGSTGSEDPRQ